MKRFAMLFSLLVAIASCSGSDDVANDTLTVPLDVAGAEEIGTPVDATAPEDTTAPEDSTALEDSPTPEDVPALLGFGATCAGNEDCESNVCHEFGELGPTCTITCDDAASCPDGSEGQKCNNKGVCKP